MCQKILITSPIYYVNDIPHIGHAYTTILCDMLKKFHQLQGNDVKFLTGTDEHGQKIEQSAKKNNQNPQSYADIISMRFKKIWDSFALDYDIFVRTTDTKHCLSVQKAFEIMYAKGDIYKGSYEGHYCISCETFFTQTQLSANNTCPDCGKPTQIVQEESYFFALSKYQDKLLEWYKSHSDFILPQFRQNEVIKFISEGLNDLSITRTSFEWGVPLPERFTHSSDKKHIVYVWLDALLSYISGLGYAQDNESDMAYWDYALHFVGKDILRFHAVYWLAFLMSLELPLPKHIYAHGWWTKDGAKMSKSIGNVINPKEVVDAYGIESLRYFLLREMPFGQDGDFSQKAFIERINAELGNDVGNLLNRLIGMSEKYFALKVDSTQVEKYFVSELNELRHIIAQAVEKMSSMQPHRYIEELWKAFSLGNSVITQYEPWNLMKSAQTDKAMALLGLIANILAQSSLLLYPIMPQSASKIAHALDFEINAQNYEKLIKQGQLLDTFKLNKIPPLFPRIESPLLAESPTNTKENAQNKNTSEKIGLVDIKDFGKLDIRVGTIIECTPVPKSEKLLKLMVDIGESQPRQILSGIAQYYTPQSLINKQVCLIINLKAAKLMGEISEGMILASKDTNGLSLLSVDNPRINGSPIS
ncbi:methionine--tRNA ligase [Helicobacter sp. MIT 21-1697]|uniref:methionine--tRNA ligase n=1 Tax=Helicobacter sp. MIT 21-1697 TaxID=2993733 RepID=UPI00224B5ED7|nr:methionine--tRNA ligase [Helicobacter sp. MIT 21-1697]MCX2717875.1 methionine--tRNA ligase [Helicobacter sp. MIT 21-1697]